MNNFSENIKKIRLEKGLTQVDMANKLGIKQSSYQQIESGRNDISLSRLQQIVEVFEMDFIDFFGYPDFNNSMQGVLNDMKKLEKQLNEFKDTVRYFKELSDERKARLVFLGKLTSKIADCLEKGYAILSKIEKQSPEIQKEIQDFVRQYDRLEEQIKQIDKET
jgi:transcriptional regulator with XRE-family HTH domain